MISLNGWSNIDSTRWISVSSAGKDASPNRLQDDVDSAVHTKKTMFTDIPNVPHAQLSTWCVPASTSFKEGHTFLWVALLKLKCKLLLLYKIKLSCVCGKTPRDYCFTVVNAMFHGANWTINKDFQAYFCLCGYLLQHLQMDALQRVQMSLL